MKIYNKAAIFLPGLVLWEPSKLQNVKHEITPINELHDEEEVLTSLETGMKGGKERGLTPQGKNLPLI